jgi:hypothetical protein
LQECAYLFSIVGQMAEGIGQKLVLRIREKVKYFVNCAKK